MIGNVHPEVKRFAHIFFIVFLCMTLFVAGCIVLGGIGFMLVAMFGKTAGFILGGVLGLSLYITFLIWVNS